jgi:putative membrane protein
MNGLFLAAVMALLADGPAVAQTSAGADKKTKADQTFVQKATLGNMTEVAMGNLALQRSQNAEVRQHAQMMVNDHLAAQQQLEQAAGGPVRRELDPKHNRMVNKLSTAKPSAFDREYANAQIKAHDDSIALHEKAAWQEGRNSAAIRHLAAAMLPQLQQHRAMTIAIAQQVGAGKATP